MNIRFSGSIYHSSTCVDRDPLTRRSAFDCALQKRELNKGHIERLRERFGVSLELFF